MVFRHSFSVAAPLGAVAEFHRCRDSLAAITPPPVRLQVQAPERLSEGDQITMVLQFGPLSVPWLARIEAVLEHDFIDRQLDGPFGSWVHRHTFVRRDEQSTQIVDSIEASLRWHPLWGPFGALMWLSLPVLFAFRSWKTRQLLEQRPW